MKVLSLIMIVLYCGGCAQLSGTVHDLFRPAHAVIDETSSLVNEVMLLPTHLGQTNHVKLQVGGSLVDLPVSAATEEYTVKVHVTTVEFGSLLQFSGEWKRILRKRSVILPMSRTPALDGEPKNNDPLWDE